MPEEPELILRLRPIEPGDKVTGFSLGTAEAAPLKAFLRKEAKNHHKTNVSKSFVLVEESNSSRVWGYLTLVCSEIDNEPCTQLEDCPEANKYPTFPAVKLVRFAIHKKLQGSGYGTSLLDWCITHVIENIMPHAGCRFLVLDAKKSASDFYLNRGFTLLDTKDNKDRDEPIMFIDLHKLSRI
ncbi:MAG: GNAT family N-acetyltransferase [Candidatus Sedimenticola sp. (ex Thyasira tokunagai)]